MTIRHHRSSVLIALLAALAQLWLNLAYGGAASFCGDGAPRRADALQAQLPPELRLPLPATADFLQADCGLCAPLCCPALPVSTTLPSLPPASAPANDDAPTVALVAALTRLLPPVRGPPDAR